MIAGGACGESSNENCDRSQDVSLESGIGSDIDGGGVQLRDAQSGDGDLARRVVALAAFWSDAVVPDELPASVDSYYRDWGKPTDHGVFVFRGIEFVGGAFVRQFGPADGTYGYIDADYFELTIGIEPQYRSQGYGSLSLAALKAKTIEAQVAGISLSTAPDNPARRLYSRLGFELVEDRGNDVLMLWRSPLEATS